MHGHLAAVEQRGVRRFGLHAHALRGDRNGFGHFADLQRDDAGGEALAGKHDVAFAFVRAEAGGGDAECVASGRKAGEDKVAVGLGYAHAFLAVAFVRELHGGAWNDRPGRIGDRSGKRAGNGLRVRIRAASEQGNSGHDCAGSRARKKSLMHLTHPLALK